MTNGIACGQQGATYTLRQIGEFLLEAPAMHGIGPAVYEQNNALVKALRQAGSAAGPGILALQLGGSRANGTSWLGSDLDLVAPQLPGSRMDIVRNCLQGTRELEGIRVNALGMAGVFLGMTKTIPDHPEVFIEWARARPIATAALYHMGAYDTGERRLFGLAALAIRESDGDRSLPWQDIRSNYSNVYLGVRSRICAKLANRLGLSKGEVGAVITPELIAERERKFGLPPRFSDHYERELAWFEYNRDSMPGGPETGIAFYAAVLRLLRGAAHRH